MTTGWFIFGVVMPVIVAGGGWLMVLAHERTLRRQKERRAGPAE